MFWHYPGYFAAGILAANSVPHFVHGISGRRFITPFASPPFVGESSPLVNVLWGLVNFVGAFSLVTGLGDFHPGFTLDTLWLFSGAALTAVGLAVYFPRVRK